jgi:hypothetical protein
MQLQNSHPAIILTAGARREQDTCEFDKCKEHAMPVLLLLQAGNTMRHMAPLLISS